MCVSKEDKWDVASSGGRSTEDIRVSRSLSFIVAVSALVALAVLILVAMAVVQAFARRGAKSDRNATASFPGSADQSRVAPRPIVHDTTTNDMATKRFVKYRAIS
ncbi:hypothetical protein MTO96_018974 [Rhipicephalus appendiculatus]